MRHALILVFAAGALLAASPAAATPCGRLNPAQKKIAQKLLDSTYPYDCCDETLSQCLKQKKVCKLAKRLRDDICRRVHRNQDSKAIKGALARRARSMSAVGKKAKIALGDLALAGETKAPVTVVVYACARCPFCSKVTPDLYRQVTTGGLKGRAKMYFKGFPIRSHKGSAIGGMAFMASQKMGKFWPYLLKLYAEYDNFAPEKLGQWAADVGLDRAAFEGLLKDKALRKQLVEFKKEGLRNGVKATPTLYINGRKYHGDLDPESLLDVLDEEADRAAGRSFCDSRGEKFFK